MWRATEITTGWNVAWHGKQWGNGKQHFFDKNQWTKEQIQEVVDFLNEIILMGLEYQCKQCGTPIRQKGFCSWQCKRDWVEEMEGKDLDRLDDERQEKETGK